MSSKKSSKKRKREESNSDKLLTENGVEWLVNHASELDKRDTPIILQVIKRIETDQNITFDGKLVKRYVVHLSDGQHWYPFNMAPEYNCWIEEDPRKLRNNAVIKVEKARCFRVKGAINALLMRFDVCPSKKSSRKLIGNPSPFSGGNPGKRLKTDSNSTSSSSSSNNKSNDKVNAVNAMFTSTVSTPASETCVKEGETITIKDFKTSLRDWCIIARVTHKPQIREVGAKNKKVLTIVLFDGETEIDATAWEERAVEIDKDVEQGKLYRVYSTKGGIKQMNDNQRKWSKSGNELQINIGPYCVFEEIGDDDESGIAGTIDTFNLNIDFTTAQEAADMGKEEFINIIGVLVYVGETTDFERNDSTTKKRTVRIATTCNHSIDVTIWDNSHCENIDPLVIGEYIVGFTGAKITAWNSCSLSVGSRSSMFVRKISDCMVVDGADDTLSKLVSWYDGLPEPKLDIIDCVSQSQYTGILAGGSASSAVEKMGMMTIKDINEQRMGESNSVVVEVCGKIDTICFNYTGEVFLPKCTCKSTLKKIYAKETHWKCEMPTCGLTYTSPPIYEYSCDVAISEKDPDDASIDHILTVTVRGKVGNKLFDMDAAAFAAHKSELSAFEVSDFVRGFTGRTLEWTLNGRRIPESYSEHTSCKNTQPVQYQVVEIKDAA